ncbi:hypothetical protein R1X32_13285 [Rhodococcus opacus]|uniref:Uncharacterized protein n=1 Tax=Rhodococcus opacus TaxID=37919 RepID=A0AAX3YQ12_RHOOP|nr:MULTISPECIES: hypothetical protein [Rhodococcus]MCZ4588547.1 hypothetical protein [Rhodococcus opacus]MDI9938574.1 hypothetical protein [Rhodococcus sp. IEGM 1351]WKN59584.1 hypothetical protein HJ581_0037845 [Rhodococcus opacus]WLF51176.1 hypothetical protein Q5707_16775 [Rhodococcus opacus]
MQRVRYSAVVHRAGSREKRLGQEMPAEYSLFEAVWWMSDEAIRSDRSQRQSGGE